MVIADPAMNKSGRTALRRAAGGAAWRSQMYARLVLTLHDVPLSVAPDLPVEDLGEALQQHPRDLNPNGHYRPKRRADSCGLRRALRAFAGYIRPVENTTLPRSMLETSGNRREIRREPA